MVEVVVNRTIRPSSRGAKSKTYKVDTSSVTLADTLRVNIDHESKPYKRSFWFNGRDVAGRQSISFSVIETGDEINISWTGARPSRLGPVNQPWR